VGSLEVGKDADIVIWDGDMFDVYTRPNMVIINGEIVHTK
jgi:imidazolonepropionase-like amidohydrolase